MPSRPRAAAGSGCGRGRDRVRVQADEHQPVGLEFVLGGDRQLDEITTVCDPTHVVQIGQDRRLATGEGQRRGALQRCVSAGGVGAPTSGTQSACVSDPGHSRTAHGRGTLAASCQSDAEHVRNQRRYPLAAAFRVSDEHSRGEVQNVRGNSSAGRRSDSSTATPTAGRCSQQSRNLNRSPPLFPDVSREAARARRYRLATGLARSGVALHRGHPTCRSLVCCSRRFAISRSNSSSVSGMVTPPLKNGFESLLSAT